MPSTPRDRRRPIARLAAAVLACAVAAGMAACGSAVTPSATPRTSSPAASSAGASRSPGSPAPASTLPALTQAPPPTPIVTISPAGSAQPEESAEPTDPPDVPGGGTTETEWGTILDQVPGGFPVFPGASPAEFAEGPVSGAWLAGGDVGAVSAWYVDALATAGYSNDLSSPLEDGSRVLDTGSDLPECRIQTTFRPAQGSTMITVLYGAGCGGGQG